ncbi:MAG TPA: hypothetical protein VMB50_02945 [Myxococcales bacterium]|nr:hypothetical protein [Myxococcales bacterium]
MSCRRLVAAGVALGLAACPGSRTGTAAKVATSKAVSDGGEAPKLTAPQQARLEAARRLVELEKLARAHGLGSEADYAKALEEVALSARPTKHAEHEPIEAVRIRRDAAARALEATRRRYHSGAVSMIEVLQAEYQLADAEVWLEELEGDAGVPAQR